MIRNIFKIEFQLASGLSIGKGDSLETDNDVITRRDGTPFIPGSSIAGVYRDLIRRKKVFPSGKNDTKGKGPQNYEDSYFGNVWINRKSEEQSPKDQSLTSRIIVYDANVSGSYVISQRDNVALDDYKTAVTGAKFDREIVNAGTRFVTFFEEILEDKDELLHEQTGMSCFAEAILTAWRKNELCFGGKTSRGLGAVKITESSGVSWRSFHLPEDGSQWADFDMMKHAAAWNPINWDAIKRAASAGSNEAVPAGDRNIRITLQLQQRGGISIRQYSTEVGEADFTQLENMDPSTGQFAPVIPGSSWAGAIRHRMKQLLTGEDAEETIELLFGNAGVEKRKEKMKSRIHFSESAIRDYTRLMMVRNAIDRFTAGTGDGALYTERAVYNGNSELALELPESTGDKLKMALAAALADLHEGFLAVGGETAIGRGLFRITGINGEEIHFRPEETEGETIYNRLMEIMQTGKEKRR